MPFPVVRCIPQVNCLQQHRYKIGSPKRQLPAVRSALVAADSALILRSETSFRDFVPRLRNRCHRGQLAVLLFVFYFDDFWVNQFILSSLISLYSITIIWFFLIFYFFLLSFECNLLLFWQLYNLLKNK